MVEFKVVGKIQPKARPRATIINGMPHIYTPRTTQDYEAIIKGAWVLGGRKTINNNLFKIIIEAYFGVPKSYTKKRRTELNNTYCNNKKDLDNIAKIILDALNGLAYTDDHNCVGLSITKYYTLEEEHIRVRIEEVGQS